MPPSLHHLIHQKYHYNSVRITLTVTSHMTILPQWFGLTCIILWEITPFLQCSFYTVAIVMRGRGKFLLIIPHSFLNIITHRLLNCCSCCVIISGLLMYLDGDFSQSKPGLTEMKGECSPSFTSLFFFSFFSTLLILLVTF